MTRFISVTAYNKKGSAAPVLLNAAAIVSLEYATRPGVVGGGEGTRLTMLNGNIFLVRESATEIFNGNLNVLSSSA